MKCYEKLHPWRHVSRRKRLFSSCRSSQGYIELLARRNFTAKRYLSSIVPLCPMAGMYFLRLHLLDSLDRRCENIKSPMKVSQHRGGLSVIDAPLWGLTQVVVGSPRFQALMCTYRWVTVKTTRQNDRSMWTRSYRGARTMCFLLASETVSTVNIGTPTINEKFRER
ncbi:hypothetical protein EDB85DRAFT_1604224 [Lactarius pseudohatsudake]|nr:hypothetical protein EDB85DRAFT_1604224 [Lactarius pseudohatsudake]